MSGDRAQVLSCLELTPVESRDLCQVHGRLTLLGLVS